MHYKENIFGIRRLSQSIKKCSFFNIPMSFPLIMAYTAISIFGWYLKVLRDISIYVAPWQEINQVVIASIIFNWSVKYFLYKFIRSAG